MGDKLKQAKFEAKKIIDSTDNFIVMSSDGKLLMLNDGGNKKQLENYVVVLDSALKTIVKGLE